MATNRRKHQEDLSLRRLQVMIPSECPLLVRRLTPTKTTGGFVVDVLDGSQGYSGRFEVVAAWIVGYLTAWRHAVQRP